MIDDLENDNQMMNLKFIFFRFLFYWKLFFVSIFLCSLFGFFYLRYTHDTFSTTAKIQILDKKDSALELPTAENLFKNSKINIENELQVLESSPVISDVIKNLNLTTEFFLIGDIMSDKLVSLPFLYEQKILIENILHDMIFEVNFNDNLNIYSELEDTTYYFENFSTKLQNHNLPFEIEISKDFLTTINSRDSYRIRFTPISNKINILKEEITTSLSGRKSEIILLSLEGMNKKYSENVLNELIKVFNLDGVEDKRLVHKRTIQFVNNRFDAIVSELDSIESKKQDFKYENKLIDIEFNSKLKLELNNQSENNLFNVENQINLTNLLLAEINKMNQELLPANIGIEDNKINEFITSYNDLVLNLKNLYVSAGPNHPSIQIILNNIKITKDNILVSLNSYINQLTQTKKSFSSIKNLISNDIDAIPENERILREIERSQLIKEQLYLFLLQKREEAEVSFAVTEPSIKVVEYAASNHKPVSPNPIFTIILCIVFGIFIPLIYLYFRYAFDTKISSKLDFEKSNLNILGEIPFFDLDEKEKVFTNPTDRSIISESFRMLMSNVRYLNSSKTKNNVIIVTSSIKGEGKTLSALNLSLSFSSVGKKVLLIGCDLRNPQLHKYIGSDKSIPGLVDFLVDSKLDWQKNIINPFENYENFDLLLSGPLPPNPLNLISNGNLELLIKDARKKYDYVILDSAPTLLVADTKSIFDFVDSVIFLTRCNLTDKEIIKHISDTQNAISPSVGVVLNGVGSTDSYSYGYKYGYGYGYNYQYSYNYGYGYGYSEDD